MKTNNTIVISYWIATLLVSANMVFVAFAYLSREPRMMASFASLGYPAYFPTILATAKILGVLALLMPGLPRLKQWAYAGFTFTFIGAIWSHLASNQTKAALFPAIALLLLVISYLCRPFNRRVLAEDEAAAPRSLDHPSHP